MVVSSIFFLKNVAGPLGAFLIRKYGHATATILGDEEFGSLTSRLFYPHVRHFLNGWMLIS